VIADEEDILQEKQTAAKLESTVENQPVEKEIQSAKKKLQTTTYPRSGLNPGGYQRTT